MFCALFLVYSQILVNLPRDDCHFSYIFILMLATLATKRKRKEKKNHQALSYTMFAHACNKYTLWWHINYLIDKMMFSMDRTCLKLTTLESLFHERANVTCQLHNEANPHVSNKHPHVGHCKHNRFCWVTCPHPSGWLHAAFNP
jgi:hypothetical protein